MAITDVLETIKDYFLNWHTNKYTELHTKETNQVTNTAPEKDYLVHSGAVKLADDTIRNDFTYADTQLQNSINNITNNELPKKVNNNQYAKASPINGIKYADPDVRGLDPEPLTTAQNGLMTWRDKAELQALGRWYECVHPDNKTQTFQKTFKSINKHSVIWVNPALRIVYYRYSCKTFKKGWWYGEKQIDHYMATASDMTNEGDNYKGSIFWDQVAPIHTIWAPTNHVGIQMGMGKDGILHFRSASKITKDITLAGSLFWFYRSQTLYNRWHINE